MSPPAPMRATSAAGPTLSGTVEDKGNERNVCRMGADRHPRARPADRRGAAEGAGGGGSPDAPQSVSDGTRAEDSSLSRPGETLTASLASLPMPLSGLSHRLLNVLDLCLDLEEFVLRVLASPPRLSLNRAYPTVDRIDLVRCQTEYLVDDLV
jgi:hypothetical protein